MRPKAREGRLLIRIDSGVLKRFRVTCLELNTNMSEEIRILIQDWINRNAKHGKSK